MLHLIFNPVAGRGRAPAALERVRGLLDASGAEYHVATTNGRAAATALAADTPAGAIVVAVGGDGTAHEVAKGVVMANRRQPDSARRVLGVVPVGSGDDFAFALGLDRRDVAQAVARLLRPEPRAIDLGWVNDEPFINSVGIGLDAEVAERLETTPSFLKGLAAYLYATLRTLGPSMPRAVTIVMDGQEVYRGRSLLVAAQNGPRTGGSFLFAPEARNDDGLLDFVIAEDLSLGGTLGLLPRVMRGRHLGHPKVKILRGSSLELHWQQPRSAHAEGEPLGAAATYRIRLEPAGLEVLG